METDRRNLRYGLMMMSKKPGFRAVAMFTLALGAGANRAIFCVVNAVLLKPLLYEEPIHLAMLWTDETKRDLHEELTSYRAFQEWLSQSRSFSELAIFDERAQVLTGEPQKRERLARFPSEVVVRKLRRSVCKIRRFHE